MDQLENCQARYRSNTWMGRTCTDGPDEFEPSKFDCSYKLVSSLVLLPFYGTHPPLTTSVARKRRVQPSPQFVERKTWDQVTVLHCVLEQDLLYAALSYDVASESEITPCNKICKPLVVYRFSGNVMTSKTTLRT